CLHRARPVTAGRPVADGAEHGCGAGHQPTRRRTGLRAVAARGLREHGGWQRPVCDAAAAARSSLPRPPRPAGNAVPRFPGPYRRLGFLPGRGAADVAYTRPKEFVVMAPRINPEVILQREHAAREVARKGTMVIPILLAALIGGATAGVQAL